jgi:carboxymethylenebutenolidase
MRACPFALLLSLAAGLALAQAPPAPQDPSAPQAPSAPAAAPAPQSRPAPAADESLPPAEEQAKAALDKSPRHGEWADVPMPAGGPKLRTWIVYPERKTKAPVVIVLQEIFGLTDWIRAVADRLAEDGFIAVAPDMLSGRGPNGGGTESVASRDDVVALVRGLTPEEVDARLDAVRAYAVKIPAATGKVGTVGFCWGGGRSFGYAVHQPALGAAVVYYGTGPSDDLASLARVRAPVLGLYGGDDARVNATIEPVSAEMKKLGKPYETEIYDGAGHGFLRAQSGRDGANLRATQKAWPRTVAFLRKSLS